ncbi:hypothetical protein [Methylocapsa sp. S129]|uniref:hypothetical protein n=1 Tax=Methylocapsa sp. S129 TaxID=1641869 RepID=UPI00131D1B93|nr:hypothetical protein [Methylocapsa sp. S129]
MSAAAGVIAAAAIAKERAEEEDMTPYSSNDLAENWEFKILRSATGKFRNSVWLHAVLQEEGRAGWTMVEKFDNARVRVKRPASARANDSTLRFDPYRIQVGMSQARLALWIIIGSLVAVAAIFGVVFLIAAATSHGGR